MISESDSPVVDIVISTYKRPVSVLKRAIDSVLQQTYKNISVAVVNDYPEDTELAEKIVELIESYKDARLKYFSYEKNNGACYARNFGASKLTGEFIEFLDDDDSWLPEKTKAQLSAFSSEKIGAVYSPFYNYGCEDTGNAVVLGTKEGNLTKELLSSNVIGGCSMVMLRRKMFDEVGGFDINLLSLQDCDLWLRISKIADIAYVATPLIFRYIGDDSISVNFEKKKKGWALFIDKNREMLEENPDIYSKRLMGMYLQSMNLGHPKEAKEYFKDAKKYSSSLIKHIYIKAKGIYRYRRYLRKSKRGQYLETRI